MLERTRWGITSLSLLAPLGDTVPLCTLLAYAQLGVHQEPRVLCSHAASQTGSIQHILVQGAVLPHVQDFAKVPNLLLRHSFWLTKIIVIYPILLLKLPTWHAGKAERPCLIFSFFLFLNSLPPPQFKQNQLLSHTNPPVQRLLLQGCKTGACSVSHSSGWWWNWDSWCMNPATSAAQSHPQNLYK